MCLPIPHLSDTHEFHIVGGGVFYMSVSVSVAGLVSWLGFDLLFVFPLSLPLSCFRFSSSEPTVFCFLFFCSWHRPLFPRSIFSFSFFFPWDHGQFSSPQTALLLSVLLFMRPITGSFFLFMFFLFFCSWRYYPFSSFSQPALSFLLLFSFISTLLPSRSQHFHFFFYFLLFLLPQWSLSTSYLLATRLFLLTSSGQ